MTLPTRALAAGGGWADAEARSGPHAMTSKADVATRKPERTYERSQSSDIVISGQVRKAMRDLIGQPASSASGTSGQKGKLGR